MFAERVRQRRAGLDLLVHPVQNRLERGVQNALPQDVERLNARATELQAELVVTTEKDACKLTALLQLTDSWWSVRLTTYVTMGEDRLKQLVLNRPDSIPSEACG